MDNFIHRIERSRRFCQPTHTASDEKKTGAHPSIFRIDGWKMSCLSPASEKRVSGSFNAQDGFITAEYARIGGAFHTLDIVRCRGPPPHLDFSTKFR